MFVRQKFDPDRQRTRVQIVHNYRYKQKVQQRVIRHVGIAHNPQQLDGLLRTATVMCEEMKQAQTQQGHLLTPKQTAELALQSKRAAKSKRKLGDVSECRERSRVSVGVREAFGRVYSIYGWDDLLGRSRKASCENLKELVLARISQPRSKRGTVLDLARNCGITLNLDRVYQTMDYLDEACIERVKRSAWQQAERLLKQPVKVLFYDVTTLYFESEHEGATRHEGDEVKALRYKGYSKDGKHHRTQVLMALTVTEEGLPVSYDVFPGNMYEGHTLQEAMERIDGNHAPNKLTVVADAGQLNSDNQCWLTQRGIAFILGYRFRNAPRALKAQMLAADGWVDGDDDTGRRYKVIAHQAQRIVVSHCPKRARKDAHTRQEALEKLQDKLLKNNSTASVAKSGYARFLDFPAGGKVRMNDEKIAAAARWDGYRAIIASGNEELTAPQLWRHYRQLWQVEYGFRTNKHDLRIRPIYHWTTKRIHSHLAICFMAYCCTAFLRHRLQTLGYNVSVEEMRRKLGALQYSVLEHLRSDKEFALPSPASAMAKRIYRSLDLTWYEVPFELPSKIKTKGRAA